MPVRLSWQQCPGLRRNPPRVKGGVRAARRVYLRAGCEQRARALGTVTGVSEVAEVAVSQPFPRV